VDLAEEEEEEEVETAAEEEVEEDSVEAAAEEEEDLVAMKDHLQKLSVRYFYSCSCDSMGYVRLYNGT